MPLTLDCLCPENDAIHDCELIELWWEGRGKYTSNKGIEASANVTLYHGVDAVASYSSTGLFSVSLSLAYAATWEDFFVRISIDAASPQTATPGGAAIYEASWWMRAVYQCGDKQFNILLYEPAGEDTYCWIVEFVTARSFAHTNDSGGYAILYSSEPLADCNGTSADAGAFDPLPSTAIDYQNSPGGSVCLCASGGTPPYLYHAVGGLPEGLELDSATGCITGSTSYQGGNRELQFEVSDANRDIADVSCNFMFECGGERGPVNAFL